MPKLFEVDDQGASAASLTEARERFDEGNVQAFGASLDTASHAPQNQIAGINALVFTEIGEGLLRAALWGASPAYARGSSLDSLGGLLDIRRAPASFTRVAATLTGSPGTLIQAGALARSTDHQFRLDQSVEIGEDGTAAGNFTAVESGAVPCPAGALNAIVSIVSGWDAVVNPLPGSVGREIESDAAYRADILARTAQSSIGSKGALESALTAAGATIHRVEENATASAAVSGGVSIPAHSLFVLADGGVDADIDRAVENHRGMGVGMYSAVIGDAVTLTDAQDIGAGRLDYNGSTLTGFDFSTDSLSSIATKVGAASPQLTVAAHGDRLLAFHSVTADTEGFSDPGANAARSPGVTDRFRMIGAEYWSNASGTSIRVRFSDAISSHGNGSPLPVITYVQNGSTVTHSMTGTTMFASGANTVWFTLGTAIPAGVTDATFSLMHPVLDRARDEAVRGVAIPLIEETADTTDAPALPQVFGYPNGTTSIRWWGWAFGTVTKWQYRRYENGDYLDNDWVDLNTVGQRVGQGLSGQSVSGFTAGLRGSRLDVRAVNGSHGNSKTTSFAFDTLTDAPTITSAEVDGRSIALTLDRPVIDTALTSNTGHWSVSSGGSVQEQRSRGNRVWLRTASAVTAGASVTLSYSSPSQTNRRIRTDSLVGMASFSNRALTNRTLAGAPGAPYPVLLRANDTGTGYRIDWTANDNGGTAVDRFEWATSVDGASWTDWTSAGTNSSVVIPDAAIPSIARVRASNPNVRVAEILGLLGKPVGSFMRSLPVALSVSVTLTDSALTANELATLKRTLIERVDAQSLGATLRVADIRSVVELLPSVNVSAMTVTSDGASVDGVAQNLYVRWTLAESDIDVIFA